MPIRYDTIRYAVDRHVLTITLAMPERLNAFDTAMANDLMAAFDRADADPDVRAIVVTGEGRCFCAGSALGDPAAFDVGEAEPSMAPLGPDHPVRDLGGTLTLRIFALTKPIVAAVNGAAVGIGATMLLPMDVRFAAQDARIGFVFSRRGIVPEAASSWFLPRVVGIGAALDWTLSGRLVPADEAARAGLFKSVHPGEELLAAAQAFARDIAENASPVSVTLTRQLMWRGLCLDDPMHAHRIDSRLMAARGAHPDSREGVSAFLEKRAPRFPGLVPADLPALWPWWEAPPFS